MNGKKNVLCARIDISIADNYRLKIISLRHRRKYTRGKVIVCC